MGVQKDLFGDEHLSYLEEKTEWEKWRSQYGDRPKPRKKFGREKSRMDIELGDWFWEAMRWVQFMELERTGHRKPLAKIARGLLQLGVYRYRDLKQLPVIGRNE